MSAEVLVTIVFGLSAAVSGWFILQGSRTRWSAVALMLGGGLALAGCATVQLDVGEVAPTLFRLAGCLALPAALVVYPRARWSDPLSFVLATIVIAAGCLCVVWPASIEPLAFVIVSALLVNAWWGLEHGDEHDRRALAWCSLAWVGSGLMSAFVGFVQESVTSSESFDITALTVALAVVGPPAMVVGVTRPELVDVRGLITRAVVAGTVLTTFIAVAMGLTSAADAVRGRPLQTTPVVVLCALLAFGVRPLQVVLRGVVDQLLFGNRPDALAAATSLADRIGDDPRLALDAIREALVVPYAALRVDGTLLASSGSEVTHTRVLPLRLGGDVGGEVVIGLRPGDLGLSSADQDVLRIVAPLLGQTLRARALARDLKESQAAVLTAIEDERLRLRRDLHDGLGPTLTGVAFSADAARNHLRAAPDRADALLVSLRAETAAAISEIRRLVDGLRPPALDELGLDGAIRQHAARLRTDGGRPIDVSVSTTHSLLGVPAAVEVAVYRIVVEALTNVTRHASATSARVDLSVIDGSLLVTVTDDGTSSSAWLPGVGLSSMLERARQVGGTMTASPCADGGRVQATIPLPPAGR